MKVRTVFVAAALLVATAAAAQTPPPPAPTETRLSPSAAGSECWDPQKQNYVSCVPDHIDHLGLKLAIGAFMAGQGADLTTTMYCIGRRLCTEANPLLEPLSDKPISLATVKMAVASVQAFVLLRIHKKHPKAATWTAVALAGVSYGIAFRNRHEMQKAERR